MKAKAAACGRGGQKKVSRVLYSDLSGREGGLKDHTWCSSRYWRRPSLPLGVTNLLGDLFALRHLLDLPHGLEAFLGCEGVALSLVTPETDTSTHTSSEWPWSLLRRLMLLFLGLNPIPLETRAMRIVKNLNNHQHVYLKEYCDLSD